MNANRLGLIVSASIFWLSVIWIGLVARDRVLLVLGLAGIGSVNISQLPAIASRFPQIVYLPVAIGAAALVVLIW